MSKSNSHNEIYKFIITPEADHLGELYLIGADLDAAYSTLELYFSKHAFDGHPKEAEDAIISSSLFRDGIILYCACFSANDPNKLHPESVYGHLEGWSGEYQRLLDIRDSFVAHNFGPQRQHNVIAVCQEFGGRLVPIGQTHFFTRFAGWIADEGKTLLPFIELARVHIKARIGEAQKPVLSYLENISSDDLSALTDAGVSLPTAEDFRSSRARFRKSGRGERMPLPPRS